VISGLIGFGFSSVVIELRVRPWHQDLDLNVDLRPVDLDLQSRDLDLDLMIS